MTSAGIRNLTRQLEQAASTYRGAAGTLQSANGQGPALAARQLARFASLSLDEPQAMRRMQSMAEDLRDCAGLDALLPKVLDGALSLTTADFGNVQLVDPASGALHIVTQSGFGAEFTDYFAVVDDDHSACGRAALHHAQTVIADVTSDPDFAPHREIAAAAGFRAVQSTPLTDSAGRLIGMVSTHFRHPGAPADRNLQVLQLYGDLAGEALARHLGLAHDQAAQRPARARRDDPGAGMTDQPVPAETALVEFAEEIARRLFAAGLSLASAQSIVGDGPAGDRVATAIDELDRAIKGIRTRVFDLGGYH